MRHVPAGDPGGFPWPPHSPLFHRSGKGRDSSRGIPVVLRRTEWWVLSELRLNGFPANCSGMVPWNWLTLCLHSAFGVLDFLLCFYLFLFSLISVYVFTYFILPWTHLTFYIASNKGLFIYLSFNPQEAGAYFTHLPCGGGGGGSAIP